MKFKQYVNFNILLEGIKIIKHDPSIKKVSSNHYTFSIEDNDYAFIVEPIPYDDQIVYNVYFTNDDKINRQHKYNNPSSVIQVFNKVITCLIYFIKDMSPYSFTFSSRDSGLSKFYGVIVPKIFKDKIFWKYNIQSAKNSFTFTRRNANESYLTSEMFDIQKTIEII